MFRRLWFFGYFLRRGLSHKSDEVLGVAFWLQLSLGMVGCLGKHGGLVF